MKAFDKVMQQIKNAPLNGHALANIRNIHSLRRASEEIKKMMEK